MIKKLIVITGPTASGKTNCAIELANHFRTEIISFDSRQFYKEMNIGTAKPTAEELAKAKHHFIGHLSIHEEYNAGKFGTDAEALTEKLFQQYDTLIAVGGSGLFMRAWLDGLDEFPEVIEDVRNSLNKLFEEKGIIALQNLLKEKDPKYFEQVDQKNPRRLLRALEVCLSSGTPYSSFILKKKKQNNFEVIKFGLEINREQLYKQIDFRTDKMMKDGLLEEATALYPFSRLLPLKTVGYTELFDYINKENTLEEAINKIKQHTRNFAKRQLTWFKKEEDIKWILPKNIDTFIKSI